MDEIQSRVLLTVRGNVWMRSRSFESVRRTSAQAVRWGRLLRWLATVTALELTLVVIINAFSRPPINRLFTWAIPLRAAREL